MKNRKTNKKEKFIPPGIYFWVPEINSLVRVKEGLKKIIKLKKTKPRPMGKGGEEMFVFFG